MSELVSLFEPLYSSKEGASKCSEL
uniref:Uncharacterized protein n=1 Tax=Anguilla anguilla TaxID=7936 RepID=A0A0E9P9B7_ANGAN